MTNHNFHRKSILEVYFALDPYYYIMTHSGAFFVLHHVSLFHITKYARFLLFDRIWLLIYDGYRLNITIHTDGEAFFKNLIL